MFDDVALGHNYLYVLELEYLSWVIFI